MPYQDVKDRLYHGHRKIANNTRLVLARDVPAHTQCIVMTLHGNVVARFYPNYLQLYSAGWYTPTTKNRLNLALHLAGISGSVFQYQHQWYVDTNLLDMVPFKNGMEVPYTIWL